MLRFTIAATLFAALPVLAQPAGGYDGKWTLHWTNDAGIQREALLELSGTSGSYAAAEFRQRGKPDPCQTHSHPVVVDAATADDLSIAVKASQTMAGCRDLKLNFHKVADGKLEGTFGSAGRAVTATRQ